MPKHIKHRLTTDDRVAHQVRFVKQIGRMLKTTKEITMRDSYCKKELDIAFQAMKLAKDKYEKNIEDEFAKEEKVS